MRTRDALLRRGAAHRSVLAAVFVTVLLTLTVVTAVALLNLVARDTAVSGVLAPATAAERVVQVEADLESAADLERLDRSVRAALHGALAPAQPDIHARAVSTSYALPGDDPDQPDLTVFATYGDLGDKVDLVDGAWPSGAAGRVPVALSAPAAEALGRAVGDRWTVRSRLDDEPVRVELGGIVSVVDEDDPALVGDPLLTRGVEAGSFTTYGPLLVAPGTFEERFAEGATATWLADPDLGAVGSREVAALEGGVEALVEGTDPELRVDTELDEVLDRVATPLTATTAVVAVAAVPLVLLAGLSLLTASRLVRDHRRVEVALLRARGASGAQLGALGSLEAVGLVVPAVLLAPWAAWGLVGLLGRAGGSGPGGVPTATAWGVAVLAGLVAGCVLVVSAARSEDLTEAVRSAEGSPGVARTGVDVLVVAAALVAAWQLSRYAGPLRADVEGTQQVDPVLVVAPALLVLAGCVVAMRLLPVALGALQPLVGRSRGLTTALAVWTVGRRLARQVGPVLTVLLAAAVVAFSLTWLATWRQSTLDQAQFVTGADVRVTGDTTGLRGAELAALPGVTAVTPVTRVADSFGDVRAELLAVDSAVAGDVVQVRDDLAAKRLPRLLSELDERAGQDDGVPLAAGTESVALVGPGAARVLPGATARAAVVQDANGLVRAVPVAEEGDRADLTGLPGPVTLLGLRFRSDELGARDVRERIGRGGPALSARSPAGGSRLPLPPGVAWQVGSPTPGTIVLTLEGAGRRAAEAVPAVVTQGLAETLGDQDLVLDGGGLSLRLRGVGVVEGLPSVSAGAAGVLVDLGVVSRAAFLQSGQVPPADPEWWLDVDGDPTATATALRAQAGGRDGRLDVLDQQSEQDALRSGSVGTALVGVLAVALLTAGLAGVSGFAAASSALRRSRRAEEQVLRALGTRRGQVARLQAMDRAGVLTAATLAGTGVGLGVAWWTLPKVTLTDAAAAPYPPIELVVPWGQLALVLVSVVVLLVVLPAVPARRRAETVREDVL